MGFVILGVVALIAALNYVHSINKVYKDLEDDHRIGIIWTTVIVAGTVGLVELLLVLPDIATLIVSAAAIIALVVLQLKMIAPAQFRAATYLALPFALLIGRATSGLADSARWWTTGAVVCIVGSFVVTILAVGLTGFVRWTVLQKPIKRVKEEAGKLKKELFSKADEEEESESTSETTPPADTATPALPAPEPPATSAPSDSADSPSKAEKKRIKECMRKFGKNGMTEELARKFVRGEISAEELSAHLDFSKTEDGDDGSKANIITVITVAVAAIIAALIIVFI